MAKKLKVCDQPLCTYWSDCPFSRDREKCLSTPDPDVPVDAIISID